MKFIKKEIRDLFFSWIAISLAFAFLRFGLSINSNFVLYFTICLLTVGAGFLLHELAHKFVAQRYGCLAEFRAFYPMLLLAIAMSFFGFIFAAPGGVFIKNHVSLKRNGIISLAGPMVNIFLALFFHTFQFIPNNFLIALGQVGAYINSWLAVFNMLPFMRLDGAKVFAWNKKIFGVCLLLTIFIMFFVG